MNLLDEIRSISCPHYEGVGGELVWCSWCVAAVVGRTISEVKEEAAEQFKEIAAIWEEDQFEADTEHREVVDRMQRTIDMFQQDIRDHEKEIDVLRADVSQLTDEITKHELREEDYQKIIREAEYYDNRD